MLFYTTKLINQSKRQKIYGVSIEKYRIFINSGGIALQIDVKMNPKYIPYLNKKQFVQIFFGGSSSGKSYFIGQKIVLDNVSGVNWLVCRNIANTVYRSVFNEIVKSISNMGLMQYYNINRSNMTITCLLNNKQILFCGLDDSEKIKSITPINGVIERVFVEEATEVKRDAIKQLSKRLRGRSDKDKYIVMAFNPILKSHFIYKDYFSNWVEGNDVYEDEHLLIVKSTYRDNMFLTDRDKELLESETDPYWRSVYVDGNWGILGHVIFTNWHVEDLSEIKKEFDHIYIGCDFGYAADPNALVKMHLDKKRKKLYVFEEWYQAGMSDSELLRICKRFADGEYVICDSAEPKTIDFLANNGIKAVGAVKGADSIMRGIRWLQDYEIIVDVQCQATKNEFEQYHYAEDKNGNVMAKPVDANNHCIDAIRYGLCDEILSAEIKAGKRL